MMFLQVKWSSSKRRVYNLERKGKSVSERRRVETQAPEGKLNLARKWAHHFSIKEQQCSALLCFFQTLSHLPPHFCIHSLLHLEWFVNVLSSLKILFLYVSEISCHNNQNTLVIQLALLCQLHSTVSFKVRGCVLLDLSGGEKRHFLWMEEWIKVAD